MRDYDRLPEEVRVWLASAALPWRPKSVRKTYVKALAKTRSIDAALDELERIQKRLIVKDARNIWGKDHPAASPDAIS